MLNSKKMLYVFSDVAYVTELLPAKKDGDFKVQEFRQINGEFLDNDTFIPENIEKLFSKLDKEEYLLVLPDFFFTNTIVEVKEKAKSKVEKYVEDKLLPSLSISDKTHQIEHFVLTQYGEKSNVQLSAIERSLLSPIYEAAKKNEVKVSKVISLSWTVKALISLEPSLSLIQMGDNLYLTQHYIGIDQATSAPVSDVEKIGETIKTLKGTQPSLQTIYLLTNELVEDKLKDILKATLPLQQLTDFKDEKNELPSYVRQVIEAGAKTLSVTDFNVPEFKVEEVDPNLVEEATKTNTKIKPEEDKEGVKEEDKEKDDKKEDDSKEETEEPVKDETEPLPEPTTPPESDDVKEEKKEEEPVVTNEEPVIGGLSDTSIEEKSDIVENNKKQPNSDMSEKTKEPVSNLALEDKKPVPKESEKDALSQFTVTEEPEIKKEVVDETKNEMSKNKEVPSGVPAKSEVIKNKTGVNSMLKMVFVSLSVFFVTVAIGVGLGLGYITLSNKGEETQQPEVIAEEVKEEVVEVSPTPFPEPEVDKGEIKLLVVNATSKAGYAGTIKKLLVTDDFVETEAGNAKGSYDEGNYILMSEENKELIDLIEKATDLKFEFSDEIKTEDIKDSYDAVVVLAE